MKRVKGLTFSKVSLTLFPQNLDDVLRFLTHELDLKQSLIVFFFFWKFLILYISKFVIIYFIIYIFFSFYYCYVYWIILLNFILKNR